MGITKSPKSIPPPSPDHYTSKYMTQHYFSRSLPTKAPLAHFVPADLSPPLPQDDSSVRSLVAGCPMSYYPPATPVHGFFYHPAAVKVEVPARGANYEVAVQH
jgi:hypothetical protein